jgi:hypothetical protein
LFVPRMTFFTLLLLATQVAACSTRSTQSETVTVLQGVLLVTNNLSESLQLRATAGSAVLWSGSVAAGAKTQAALGNITAGSFLSLLATSQRGATVSFRDSVIVRNDTLIWIIP